MEVPALQYAPGKPPSRSIYINVTPVAVSYAPHIDWHKVFGRVCSYFTPFNIHLATFPYATQPRCICEVEVSWAPFPGIPSGMQGATPYGAFLGQRDDYTRIKSYVFLRPIMATAAAIPETQIQLAGDAIAHEAVHWHIGPRHVTPAEGKPGVPNTTWLMAEGNAWGDKILDNQTINMLTKVLGRRG